MLSGRVTLIEDKTTDPLFMKEGSSYYFYQNDHLGTPQKMTAINGAVVWAAKYESFGKATVDVETVTNNLRFPGQYEDEETGLHYNRFRYYDLRVGRYLSKDPLGTKGGVNLFVYAQNSPVRFLDPFGLKEICVTLFSNKTEWEFEPIGEPEWKSAGSTVIMAGLSGVCHWKKIEKGFKVRTVVPVKLCFDTCDKSLYYEYDFSKQKKEYEHYERQIGSARTSINWLPAEVGYIRICDPKDIKN